MTMVLGFAGAAVSYLSLREGRSANVPDRNTAKVSALLAVAMLLFAFFIGGWVLPLSTAYSGPVPETVPIKLYDKYLAALIALAFAVVFAFDTFLLSRSHSHSQ